MTQTDVLLVDDEPQLVRALRPALIAGGYNVTVAENGQDALQRIATEGAGVVLLDLGLPDMDGTAVIERIRSWSDVPIIVLSARDNELQKVEALDIGADDYVSKPFSVGELLARLRAVQRGRDRRFDTGARVSVQGLEIDFAARRVTLCGDDVKLTVREYELLRVLARHAGRVVTRQQIIAAVWGASREEEVDPQFLRVLVSQLRSKIEEDASAPKLVLTEIGLGYRLAF